MFGQFLVATQGNDARVKTRVVIHEAGASAGMSPTNQPVVRGCERICRQSRANSFRGLFCCKTLEHFPDFEKVQDLLAGQFPDRSATVGKDLNKTRRRFGKLDERLKRPIYSARPRE